MKTFDVCVVGGGVVGLSIALGEERRGKRVVVLDGDREDRKASFANFGLVWVQGKGCGMPAYKRLTEQSSADWGTFAEMVEDLSGEELQYERDGGLVFCLSTKEFEDRRNRLLELDAESGTTSKWEMIGRNETQMKVGDFTLGREVVGASYCRSDGAVNPLQLARSLVIAFQNIGGTIVHEAKVDRISAKSGGWEIHSNTKKFHAGEVVVAAGLGSKEIAEQMGVHLPISADKGQILVSARQPMSMQLPASGLRQTMTGSFMIGATHEGDSDQRSTISSGAKLAQRAIRILPQLEHVPLVRQWAGHRIVTPDTYPVYVRGENGIVFAACHSGITLASFHCSDWMQDETVFEDFTPDRF